MRRRSARVTAALACTLALGGCAGLPATSSVGVGRAVDSDVSADAIDVAPDGPARGETAQQTVIGFLQAHIGIAEGYSVARSFLAPVASRLWHPGTAVTIYGDVNNVSMSRPDVGTVRVRVPVTGSLSADGHLTRLTSPQARTLDFSVVQTNDGWRISAVPPNLGVWLSDSDFTRLYRSVEVYYPSRYGHIMVADPRWLPRQGLATALARATLSEPPAWLRSAVHLPFPSGTGLDVNAVPVSSEGVAGVDLSKQALAASAPDRAAMWAALVATVTQAPDVESVGVSSQGAPVEGENLPSTAHTAADVGYQMPSVTSSVVVARSGRYLAWVDPTAATASSGTTQAVAAGRPALPAVPASWSLLAVGPGGRQLAAVSADRTSVRRWLNGTDVTIAQVGTDLVQPTFDVYGQLWCAGQARSDSGHAATSTRGAVWVFDTTKDADARTPRPLSMPWLGQGSVEAVSIASDGARAALVVNDGHEHRRLVLAGIVRDTSGHPTALSTPMTVPGVVDPRDVAWSGDVAVAVIAGSGVGRGPQLVSLDGDVTALNGRPGAVSVSTVGSGAEGVFAAERGSVYRRVGSSWSSFLTNGSLITPAS